MLAEANGHHMRTATSCQSLCCAGLCAQPVSRPVFHLPHLSCSHVLHKLSLHSASHKPRLVRRPLAPQHRPALPKGVQASVAGGNEGVLAACSNSNDRLGLEGTQHTARLMWVTWSREASI